MDQKHFVFTISTGRSGTAYLSDLFARNVDGAECIHEMGFLRETGRGTPDLSHKIEFNMRGNTSHVRDFWKQKIGFIRSRPSHVHVETSHLHCKSGLIENLDLFGGNNRVLIVDLRRDALSTLKSFAARQDFISNGNALLFYLDPSFLRKITYPAQTLSSINWMAWYIIEMRCRGAFYERIIQEHENVSYLRCDIEMLADTQVVQHLFNMASFSDSKNYIEVPSAANKGSDPRLSKADLEEFTRIAESVNRINTDEIAQTVYQKGWRF